VLIDLLIMFSVIHCCYRGGVILWYQVPGESPSLYIGWLTTASMTWLFIGMTDIWRMAMAQLF